MSHGGGAPGRNRTDVAALIWRVLSPVYKAGALTNVSYRGADRLRSGPYSGAACEAERGHDQATVAHLAWVRGSS